MRGWERRSGNGIRGCEQHGGGTGDAGTKLERSQPPCAHPAAFMSNVSHEPLPEVASASHPYLPNSTRRGSQEERGPPLCGRHPPSVDPACCGFTIETFTEYSFPGHTKEAEAYTMGGKLLHFYDTSLLYSRHPCPPSAT